MAFSFTRVPVGSSPLRISRSISWRTTPLSEFSRSWAMVGIVAVRSFMSPIVLCRLEIVNDLLNKKSRLCLFSLCWRTGPMPLGTKSTGRDDHRPANRRHLMFGVGR